MTSRRPMTRSFSGNGRTSSFSEEEGSSTNGRSESRNPYLSNVRPENRSTLCTVMAQLTEDIQPSFETTLKSKAVSENCNVKFTCVVSGYPTPELKWYKDDMEMDRYCGLPKYEIRRKGKVHTLHIYNCTLDDAAIYQASASNSKGIVSCSGVLEVGIMNEFKIHQRFFAKLKQKAEKKRKEMDEQTKKEDKENIQKVKPPGSPERPPRKRHVPMPEETPTVQMPEAVEPLGAVAEANGVSSEVIETAPVTSIDSDMEKEMSPSTETLAKKKIKISNGVDDGVNNSSSNSGSHAVGNGGENCYDGGISLAQFLAEALQSQAAEEKQKLSLAETCKEMDMTIVSAEKENERKQIETEEKVKARAEYERDKRREQELAKEREKERERQFEQMHTVAHTKHGPEVKHHSKAHKDHEHHNIQASISSMLHSVKDFFFGKSKKDFHDHTEKLEKEVDHQPASTQPYPPLPQTPPLFRLQPEECKPLAEEVVPMEMDKLKEPSVILDTEQRSVSLEPLKPHENEDSIFNSDLSESVMDSMGLSAQKAENAVEAMEVSVEAEIRGPGEEISESELQLITETREKDSLAVSVIQLVPVIQQEPVFPVVPPEPDHQVAKDECSVKEDRSDLPRTEAPCEEKHSPTSTLTSLEENWPPPHNLISKNDSQGVGETTTETLQEDEMNVDKSGKESQPDTQEGRSAEKAEVKSKMQQCPDINTSEITELMSSLEERRETCDSEKPIQVLSLPPVAAAYSAERDNHKAELKGTPLFQEMNVAFPTTAGPESLGEGDLKILRECTHIPVANTEGQHLSAKKASVSALERNEKESEVKEVCIPDVEKNIKDSLKIKQQAVFEDKITEERNESLQTISMKRKFGMDIENEAEMKVEEFSEPKSSLDTRSDRGNANVSGESSNIAHPDGSESHLMCPTEGIPQIKISTIEYMPNIEPTGTDERLNEQIIIPKIEVMEPQIKESSLPSTVLTHYKSESEPFILQKCDVTEARKVIIKDHNVVSLVSDGMLPSQKGMIEHKLLPTEEVKEVAQLEDRTEKLDHKPPDAKSSEQFPQMDFASIPIINVSCSEDSTLSEAVDAPVQTHVSDTPQLFNIPTVPLFVVPPVSVICHESAPLMLPTQSEGTGTETSAVIMKETKFNADNNMTTKPEKTNSMKQTLEEIAHKSITDNAPTILYEDLTSNITSRVLSLSQTTEDNVPEILKTKSLKEDKTDAEDLQRNRSSVERLGFKTPTHPTLSPASLRKFVSKAAVDSDTEAVTGVPVITVGDRQNDKAEEDLSGGSTPTSSLSCENSPRLKRRDSLSLIRSATPEELASGARRKIFIPKSKGEDGEGAAVSLGVVDSQGKKETPYMSPSQARRAALLQAPTGQNTPPMERRSPLLARRKATLEVPKVVEEIPTEVPASSKKEEKPAEKKFDPLKAPQVIRKVRGEPFPDASGHLKLWCQFFNVLSDSTIKWYRDEEEIREVKRSGGDESQVALAIVLASSQDCGVYGCTIKNEYGTDTTDFLLSEDILSEILLRDELEVGEEIEMTPLLFTKGLADCGSWGDKYFGRIMTEMSNIGEGCAHKASRVKVIYGLDPVFESGSTCIIKVQNPIPYGTKQESNLAERNLEITKQECKVQNMIREYCKIFAAEARVSENFGFSLEVIPQYLMYRPANSVPYATVEADLNGVFHKYCTMDGKGKLISQTVSELEQKCCTFQHWIHQWTHGNLLVTQLEGVETKLTNIRALTKSKGYQGLTEHGSPEVFEQFVTHHQCNYFCGLLGLRPLKTMDSLQQPAKMKGSKSPLLNRKLSQGSCSPQLQRKGAHSPQMPRKATSSPKVNRKAQETEDSKSDVTLKPVETLDVLETR